MHDGRHARGDTSTLEFEDVITVDLPDDGYVDHEHLREIFREPRTYLPLRRRRAARDLEDLPREVESRFAHRAKITSLLAAATILIGAVIAAAILAEQPVRGAPPEGDTERFVTGVDALGAFTALEAGTLPGTSESSTSTPAPAHPVSEDSTSTASLPQSPTAATEPDKLSESPVASRASSTTTVPQGSSSVARSADTGERSAAATDNPTPSNSDVVRRFYQHVANSPEQALRMLAPRLLGNRTGELRRAWRSFADARVVEITERPHGAVCAIVTVRQPDGTRKRLTQLFDFADQGLIDHVQLLSAQQN